MKWVICVYHVTLLLERLRTKHHVVQVGNMCVPCDPPAGTTADQTPCGAGGWVICVYHVTLLPEQLRTKPLVVQVGNMCVPCDPPAGTTADQTPCGAELLFASVYCPVCCQFEAVVQEGNEALVHHMEVFHCVAPPDQNIPEYKGPCFAPQRPETTQVCKRVLAAWAMGAPPFVYPEEAGLPIGGPDFNSYVMLEIHYNNPEKRSDWVDSTGVRLYISPTLRKYDGGVIELGLEYTDKMAIPPHQPQFTLTGYCISECTAVSMALSTPPMTSHKMSASLVSMGGFRTRKTLFILPLTPPPSSRGIPPEGIVIFGSQLHTHLTGIRVFTRHIRDGRELPELNRDNHYSTHFQEIRLLKREVRVLPGDALITTCWYQTTERTNTTMGGYAISDEMCVNYVHYYPKVDLEVCKSSISNNALDTYFRFLREWEDQPTSSSQGISSNYQAVDWTPMRSQMLEQMYQQFPISMQCNQSSGERFPGYWEDMISSHVLFPLPPQARECSTEETV
uniref:Uncharacterized protein n=1 Tax=Timema douglasi TaxID=61478 RepID=A0A7R8Z4Y0_TIMDO|nr:unnamed protein product [Timema douglasi]